MRNNTVIISETSRKWANNLNDLRDRWKIRREVSSEKEWMPVSEFENDIKKLSRGELLHVKTGLIEILNEIKHRIGISKSRAFQYGKYSDSDIFREMQAAERSVSKHIEATNHALSRLKGKRTESVEREFVDVAKKRLPNDLFWEIMSAAQDKFPEEKL